MTVGDSGMLARAQGCLLGQLAGDSLGSLVEFKSPGMIRKLYPKGVKKLENGGVWGTLAGQPTDDSEMALLLARMLVDRGSYDVDAALQAYKFWLDSGPFDCGSTIGNALCGRPSPGSQANGALMRVSPLGIFGAGMDLKLLGEWAAADAALTHCNLVCRQINALYVQAVARAVQTGCTPKELYEFIGMQAEAESVEMSVLETIHKAETTPPDDYVRFQGWVLIAFQNALWQLLHASDLESGVVDTVIRGGDTDTNAAICGALLGAVYGIGAVPGQWKDAVLSCRPEHRRQGVCRPRPGCFWPVDVLKLAENLLLAGKGVAQVSGEMANGDIP